MARAKKACKITLEVLEHNHPARATYSEFGFVGYEQEPTFCEVIFLENYLKQADRR